MLNWSRIKGSLNTTISVTGSLILFLWSNIINLTLLVTVLPLIYEVGNSIHYASPAEKKLRAIYGRFVAFAIQALLPDTVHQWNQIDHVVRSEGDEAVLAFKASYVADCTQTAVAVCSPQVHIVSSIDQSAHRMKRVPSWRRLQ